ncbi:MAG: hypothetical protein QMC36_02725 [Patescibacteria group bacterium]
MILQKPDATGKSVPFKAAEFVGQPFHPALAALENVDHSAVILFHPVFRTIECKWLTDGEYVTMFKIVTGDGGLSEKDGISIPMGKLVFGVDDENLCLERLKREMFEAVQALAFDGGKLPGLTTAQSTQNFWTEKMGDLAHGLRGERRPSKPPHTPDFESYARLAAKKFFIIAKLNEAIRILSFPPLRALEKAA